MTHNLRVKMALLCGCALGTLGAAQPAWSAEATSAATTVGEVVVTAQRRAENLEDVPASISVVSGADIAKAGINSTQDLSRASPSVNIQFYGSFMQPAVRGVSSTGANVGDNSNVALYIDGVYQPMQQASLIDLPDVEQIEVLKGPQGALYGQNATGGAILVNSFAPSFTPTGKLSASYGNYDAVDLRGYVSGPITDYLAASLSGGYDNHKGFRKQVVTGQRDKGLDSETIRGKLLFKPADWAKATLTAYYTRRADSASYATFAINNNTFGKLFFPNLPAVTRADQYGTDPRVNSDTKEYGGSLRGEFTTDLGTLTALTGVTRTSNTYFYDADNSPANVFDGFQPHNTSRYFTQEVTFASRDFGPFSFLAGAFYLNGNEVAGSNTEPVTTGFHNPVTLMPAPPAPLPPSLTTVNKLDKEILAAYGELTWHASDKLTVTAGGRYSSETQHAFVSKFPGVADRTLVVERPGGGVTFNSFTPRVTVRYELAPQTNVYFSFNKGFKSGVINTAAITSPPVNPEKITAYEVGFKGRLMPTLSFSAAAFYYDYKDMQFVTFQPLSMLYLDQNAASSHIKGADFDVTWAATEQFTLTGSLALLHARFVKFPAAQVFVPTGFGDTAVTRDVSGQKMPRSPSASGSIAADYHVDTDMGRFGAHGSFYYNSGFGFSVSNRLYQDSYSTVNGEVSFAPAAVNGLRLVLWGKNLGNKAYLMSVLDDQLTDAGAYAEPRTFGVRAEYAF